MIGPITPDPAHLILAMIAIAAIVVAFHFNGKKQRLVEDLQRKQADHEAQADTLRHTQEALATQRTIAENARLAFARLEARREQDEKQFSSMAKEAVDAAHNRFIERADERLQLLMKPVGDSFEKFGQKVEEIGRDRASIGKQIELTGKQLKQNEDATLKLVTALSTPTGGGRWGEESLKNVLKSAGLHEHVDFDTQVTINQDRPDAIIRLPSGRSMIIDAKASAAAFIAAQNESDAQQRQACIEKHARHVRENMKRLAGKAYQDRIRDTVDFVVMYIPGENMFSAALANEPTMLDEAFKSGVIMTSPATLVALAKTVALGWQEAKMAENAREISKLGHDLYESLCTFGQKVNGLGTSLERSVGAYNDLVASLEGRVMPRGRKFNSLGIATPTRNIGELNTIERQTRLPVAGKDLQLGSPQTHSVKTEK